MYILLTLIPSFSYHKNSAIIQIAEANIKIRPKRKDCSNYCPCCTLKSSFLSVIYSYFFQFRWLDTLSNLQLVRRMSGHCLGVFVNVTFPPCHKCALNNFLPLPNSVLFICLSFMAKTDKDLLSINRLSLFQCVLGISLYA
jgi:hypothetical protein